jgi:hypothetical protein
MGVRSKMYTRNKYKISPMVRLVYLKILKYYHKHSHIIQDEYSDYVDTYNNFIAQYSVKERK